MRTIHQELPKGQKEIIQSAIETLETALKSEAKRNPDNETIHFTLFDLNVLKAMLNYKVEVVLTQEEMGSFTATNKVDFPLYVK